MPVGLAHDDPGKTREPEAMAHPMHRIEQARDRDPERLAHLVVSDELDPRLDAIDERGEHERRDETDARVEIAEPSEALRPAQIESDLFQRLALGGGAIVGVAGNAILARPRVAEPRRAR
jgi:hypothetical protein